MMFLDAAPIINGTYDANDQAVVQIYAYPPTKDTLYTCTGTLISTTHVLAAAHCFAHDANYIYGILTEPNGNDYHGQISQVESHLKMAASVTMNPTYAPQSATFLGDIGILTLAAPITDITPLQFNRTAPDASMVGAQVTIIGYGQTSYGTNQNNKYSATTTITNLDNGADTITVGGSGADPRSCLGDSGGPVLLNNVVLGVDSYAPVGCTDPAHYRRADYYQDWIDSVLDPSTGSGSDMGSNTGSDTGSGSDDTTQPSHTEPGGCNAGHNAGILVALSVILVRRRRK
ncbi:MAG: trypsin-like serine protease [Kofleriaceae bacterium]